MRTGACRWCRTGSDRTAEAAAVAEAPAGTSPRTNTNTNTTPTRRRGWRCTEGNNHPLRINPRCRRRRRRRRIAAKRVVGAEEGGCLRTRISSGRRGWRATRPTLRRGSSKDPSGGASGGSRIATTTPSMAGGEGGEGLYSWAAAAAGASQLIGCFFSYYALTPKLRRQQ